MSNIYLKYMVHFFAVRMISLYLTNRIANSIDSCERFRENENEQLILEDNPDKNHV
jgi:hypothetical protein